MNIKKIDKEVAPTCQAAHDLVQWAENVVCDSGSEANDKMIVKAVPLFGPLKSAIEKGDANNIFQLARMVGHELSKRPEKFDPDHPIMKLQIELEKVLHAEDKDKAENN